MKFVLCLAALVVVAAAEDCNQICLDYFDPVCGSDGVTYSNQCYLEAAACRQSTTITAAHKGMCRVRPVPGTRGRNCQRMCTMEYDPVCGSDGHTYGNRCEMSVAACMLGQDIKVAGRGRCDDLQFS